MKHRHRFAGLIILSACLFVLPGCSKKTRLPPPVDISGEVVYANGRPVTNMVVSFHADDEITSQGKIPSSPLDKDGKFAMSGVTPGKYRVTLAPIPSHGGASANPNELIAPGKDDAKVPLPSEYLRTESTPWKVTVESPPKAEKLVVNTPGAR